MTTVLVGWIRPCDHRRMTDGFKRILAASELGRKRLRKHQETCWALAAELVDALSVELGVAGEPAGKSPLRLVPLKNYDPQKLYTTAGATSFETDGNFDARLGLRISTPTRYVQAEVLIQCDEHGDYSVTCFGVHSGGPSQASNWAAVLAAEVVNRFVAAFEKL